MTQYAFAGLFVLALGGTAPASEISTNGVGGGAWTDPATWRGKQVPGPEDEVVIRKHDVVVYNAGGGGATCRKLLIDPRGGLTFKTGAGRLILSVTDGVESYGAIRLDATKSTGDDFALRLVGDVAAKRLIKLGKGGALLLYGRALLPAGRRNVAIIAPQRAGQKEPLPGLVEAEGAVMIDWQRANVNDVKLIAKSIDNTGAKPNERIKLADNHFIGVARVTCQQCDTPEIAKNSFDNTAGKPIDEPAINVNATPLAEIKNNVIRGGFLVGIAFNYRGDAVIVGNTVEKCATGMRGSYGVPNTMIKQAVIRDCPNGIMLEGATGVLEDVTIEGATIAYQHENSQVQLTHVEIKALAPKGTAILLTSGTLSLLNCPVLPEQIKLLPQKPPADKPPSPLVTCLQYAVIVAKGAPPGSIVEVRTAGTASAADSTDPNVRNSPAALTGGLSPLPRTLTPLMVKAWTYDPGGKLVPAPEYAAKVLGPAPKEGAARPVLASQTFRPMPGAFRADPSDKTPTLEVLVK